MVALREVLSRFRPATPPGAPTGGGAPADHAAERGAELEPVFDALQDAEDEAERLRAEAARKAALTRDEGVRRAEAIVREALDHAPPAREAATRSVLAESDAYCAARLAEARVRAGALRSQAGPLVDEFVARVVGEAVGRLRGGEAEAQ